MKHEFKIKIEAGNEAEATNKMKALVILASKLTTKEISKLADVVKNNPVQTALAKKYLGL
ncbi:hypothetical protein CAP35_07660 [Chitinophagaceae bacterium IBVUCB1]|nr:hypothetical protein CAP35_07660 [Chitinophagaceae bacterium IBVUCB1]